ncbi:TonB-dependent receptor [Pseudomonas sp. LRF_L74]|uniref:TonB-dependent receptor n=1 Tax=Pseudomonas sp. LRF_L74 TaxID=3369422 RepID=UPI003F61B29E
MHPRLRTTLASAPGQTLRVARFTLLASAASLGVPLIAVGSTEGGDSDQLETVEVVGTFLKDSARKADLGPSVRNDIAAVLTIDQDDIRRYPLSTTADLFRVVPGFQVDDFQNGGIAQGVGARGWPSMSDGQYVATYIDGFQRNLNSGPTTNGYNDLNPLIPEIVESIDVVRGPFDARYGGNYALAGSAVFTTKDKVENRVQASLGSYGRKRLLATGGVATDDYSFYTAVEGLRDSGYRDNNDDHRINLFSKLVLPRGDDRFDMTFQYYDAEFGQGGSFRKALYKSGSVSPRQAVNEADKGDKEQFTLTARYLHVGAGYQLDTNAYFDRSQIYRSISRNDPGQIFPQYLYEDDRYTLGGNSEFYAPFLLGSLPSDIRTGVGVRGEFAKVDRQPGFNNQPTGPASPWIATTGLYTRADFDVINPNAYATLSVKPAQWLKLSGSVRYDRFSYDIDHVGYSSASRSITSRDIDTDLNATTFKGGVAITPVENVTLFANYGESFSTPNVNTELPYNSGLDVALLKSTEVGIDYNDPRSGIYARLGAYHTTNEDEIGTDPLTSLPANLGKSKREGWDAEFALRVFQNGRLDVSLNGNYSKIKARLDDSASSYIPNVADHLYGYGVAVSYLLEGSQEILFKIDQQFIGKQPLNASGSIENDAYDRINAKLSYDNPGFHGLSLWLGAIIYSDRYAEAAFLRGGEIWTAARPKTRLETGVSVAF